MMKTLQSLFVVLSGLVLLAGNSIANESNEDKQDIVAACTEESKGAIDVQEYISECIKDKEEELKNMAQDAEAVKEKS